MDKKELAERRLKRKALTEMALPKTGSFQGPAVPLWADIQASRSTFHLAFDLNFLEPPASN